MTSRGHLWQERGRKQVGPVLGFSGCGATSFPLFGKALSLGGYTATMPSSRRAWI